MRELARVFTESKTVDSRVLNVAGAQPFRSLLARTVYKLRAAPHDAHTAELTRTGMLMIEDFLPPESFSATAREADDYITQTLPRWLHQHGNNTVYSYPLATVDAEQFPHLARWRNGGRALSLASAAERRPLTAGKGTPLIEHINLGDDSETDPQSVLHLDTFFNTHKVWLYLDDVTAANGAFIYVPGSHRFDRARLRDEYLASTREPPCLEPSRRVSDDEVRRRGLERRVVTCPQNTLLIVNTCGYHCRSVGEAGATRRALHMAFRFNPFRYPMPRTARAIRRIASPFPASRAASSPPTLANPSTVVDRRPDPTGPQVEGEIAPRSGSA